MSAAKRNEDHVVINGKTGSFECRHCKASQVIPFPVSFDMINAMSKVFLRAHRNCKAPKGVKT